MQSREAAMSYQSNFEYLAKSDGRGAKDLVPRNGSSEQYNVESKQHNDITVCSSIIYMEHKGLLSEDFKIRNVCELLTSQFQPHMSNINEDFRNMEKNLFQIICLILDQLAKGYGCKQALLLQITMIAGQMKGRGNNDISVMLDAVRKLLAIAEEVSECSYQLKCNSRKGLKNVGNWGKNSKEAGEMSQYTQLINEKPTWTGDNCIGANECGLDTDVSVESDLGDMQQLMKPKSASATNDISGACFQESATRLQGNPDKKITVFTPDSTSSSNQQTRQDDTPDHGAQVMDSKKSLTDAVDTCYDVASTQTGTAADAMNSAGHLHNQTNQLFTVTTTATEHHNSVDQSPNFMYHPMLASSPAISHNQGCGCDMRDGFESQENLSAEDPPRDHGRYMVGFRERESSNNSSQSRVKPEEIRTNKHESHDEEALELKDSGFPQQTGHLVHDINENHYTESEASTSHVQDKVETEMSGKIDSAPEAGVLSEERIRADIAGQASSVTKEFEAPSLLLSESFIFPSSIVGEMSPPGTLKFSIPVQCSSPTTVVNDHNSCSEYLATHNSPTAVDLVHMSQVSGLDSREKRQLHNTGMNMNSCYLDSGPEEDKTDLSAQHTMKSTEHPVSEVHLAEVVQQMASVGAPNAAELFGSRCEQHDRRAHFCIPYPTTTHIAGEDHHAPDCIQLPPLEVHAAGAVPPWATRKPCLNHQQAASPAHANLLTRRATYHNGWPADSSQDLADLALAGFYYTERNRHVRCWWCGVEFDIICSGSDPWRMHAYLSPSCRYLTEMTR